MAEVFVVGFFFGLINVSTFFGGYLTVGRTRLKLSLVVSLQICVCVCKNEYAGSEKER